MSSFANLLYFHNITKQSDKVKNSSLDEHILKAEQIKDNTNIFNKIHDNYVNPPKKPIIHVM